YQNKTSAKRFIRNLSADGGTEMAAALNLALESNSRGLNSDRNTIRQVVFLTDGSVGNEEGLFRLIKSKLGDSRLFTVGIGSAPNSYFMTKAARQGRGTFTYIGDVNEVQQKMALLFEKLDSPVLKNIHIDFNTAGALEIWPEKQPDLYKGEPIIVVAKSTEQISRVKVSADLANRKWQMDLKVTQTESNNDISVLWARQKINHLMDKLHDGENKETVKQQIVKVALKHHLVSKFTSLVAVDVTPSRPLHEAMNKHMLKTNLPKGMIHKKVFGNLPQTATASELNLLIGFILLLIAIAILGYQALANNNKAI
ncbi:Inter-alpha-trypsin inhibitor domain protein, partial [hydrothermal vent metagenome]